MSTSFKKCETQEVPRRRSCSDGKEMHKKAWCARKIFFAKLSLSMRFCCSRCRRRHRYLAPFYCLHFIFARIHVRITRQWKHLKGNVRLAYEWSLVFLWYSTASEICKSHLICIKNRSNICATNRLCKRPLFFDIKKSQKNYYLLAKTDIAPKISTILY